MLLLRTECKKLRKMKTGKLKLLRSGMMQQTMITIMDKMIIRMPITVVQLIKMMTPRV